MKTLILTAMAVFTLASAEATVLECSFPKLSQAGKLFISLDQLETPEQTQLNYDRYTDYEGEAAAFSYEGNELEWLWMLALSYDGQSVELDRRGNLSFFFDSDGCDVGKLYLYGNNQFRFGYLSIDHHCSGPEQKRTYSLARCQVQ